MAENNAQQAPAKKGKLKLIIVLVIIILLAIGLSVAGTLWFLKDGTSADSAETEEASQPPQFTESIYTNLDKALVTTIQAEGRQRYSQVYLSFEAKDPAALAAVDTHMPLIRSQLVMVLGASDFNELQTPEGRKGLAEQMLATVNEVLAQENEPAIKRVLFRNFVVQ